MALIVENCQRFSVFHTASFGFIFRSEVMKDLGTSVSWSQQEGKCQVSDGFLSSFLWSGSQNPYKREVTSP